MFLPLESQLPPASLPLLLFSLRTTPLFPATAPFSPRLLDGLWGNGAGLRNKGIYVWGLFQGNRGRIGVVIAAYMHYSNISAR